VLLRQPLGFGGDLGEEQVPLQRDLGGGSGRCSLDRPNTSLASNRLCCSSWAMVSRCDSIVWRC
jgi:hypothetical protein